MSRKPTQIGFPGGKKSEIEEEEDELEEGDKTPKEETDAEKKEREREEELQTLRKSFADLETELRELRAKPPEKKGEVDPKKPKDWAEAFYKDANKAMADFRKEIHEEITGELRQEYQGARGEEQFWNAFYAEHPDLKEDDDLVKLTLQKNRSALGNLPVEKAAAELANLTRERLLRYGGNGNKETGRKRPFTEAGGSGRPPKREEQQEEKVVTLSSVLRERAQKRRAGGKATAA